MLAYPVRLDLAQTPTPFYALDRLRASLQDQGLTVPRLWIKRDDLTGCLTSGNKVRKLEFFLADAKRQGCQTIITSGGVQSNHCRAVAVLGAQLGFKVHLLLRLDSEPNPVGNLLLDQLLGAEISYYSKNEFQQLDQLFDYWHQQYADRGISSYCIPTGGSNEVGLWGYIAAAEELQKDFLREQMVPERIIHATGSGGTQAGLTLGCYLLGINTTVEGYAVCDDVDYFNTKILQDITAWRTVNQQPVNTDKLTIETNDQYRGPSYAVAKPEVYQMIKFVAATEGIVLDHCYTGKAFYGMLEDIKRGRFSADDNLVFIHTGGLFGLLSQQDLLDY
jgi:D-cysteine desulfhydrase